MSIPELSGVGTIIYYEWDHPRDDLGGEIDSKLDGDFIDFSGVEKFLDTAVKFLFFRNEGALGIFSGCSFLDPEDFDH